MHNAPVHYMISLQVLQERVCCKERFVVRLFAAVYETYSNVYLDKEVCCCNLCCNLHGTPCTYHAFRVAAKSDNPLHLNIFHNDVTFSEVYCLWFHEWKSRFHFLNVWISYVNFWLYFGVKITVFCWAGLLMFLSSGWSVSSLTFFILHYLFNITLWTKTLENLENEIQWECQNVSYVSVQWFNIQRHKHFLFCSHAMKLESNLGK